MEEEEEEVISRACGCKILSFTAHLFILVSLLLTPDLLLVHENNGVQLHEDSASFQSERCHWLLAEH